MLRWFFFFEPLSHCNSNKIEKEHESMDDVVVHCCIVTSQLMPELVWSFSECSPRVQVGFPTRCEVCVQIFLFGA